MSFEDLRRKVLTLDETSTKFKEIIYAKEKVGDNETERVERPLNAIADIAKLARAHTTKVGISFRPPVSGKAAQQCVSDLSSLTPLFAAACIGMKDDLDGKVLRIEVRSRLTDLYNTLSMLAKELLSVLDREEKTPTADKDAKSDEKTLVSIGQVWECCDALIQLPLLGLGGVIAERLDGFSSMIKDGLNDLEEWIVDPSVMEDFLDLDEEEDTFGIEDESADDFASAEGKGKAGGDGNNNDELEEKLELSKHWQLKLRKISVLYGLIKKQRCGPKTPLDTKTLNAIYEHVNDLSASSDDFIASFLEGGSLESIKEYANVIVRSIGGLCDLVLTEKGDTFDTVVTRFKADFVN
ncbi:hypothetical protein TRVA0_005S00452 [Trichomonascus vanleenenianus]|uniref:uncharacterized protein n=1 Tax=Trichomonascus vanleenenianus TaxID=2268995 RepID=UPI003EC963D0